MRIVVAECSAIYTGRGDTKLPVAVRALIIKSDGSVSLHHDLSNKPLNYMGAGNTLTVEEDSEDGTQIWTFDTSKESLQIVIHNLISDTFVPLDISNSELVRDGTEKQLQDWLAINPQVLNEGWVLVQQEYSTTAGPVDLLFKDEAGTYYCVEVKRVALTNSIHQVLRYYNAIVEDDDTIEHVVPIVVALEMRPKATTVAARKNVEFIEVPANWNKDS